MSYKKKILIIFLLIIAAACLVPSWRYTSQLFILKKYSKLSHSNPIFYLDRTKLNNKLKNIAPAWMLEQINSDLEKFKHKKYSYQDLAQIQQQYQSEHNQLALVTIKNNQVNIKLPNNFQAKKYRPYKVYQNILEYLAKNNYINNINFLLCLEDFIDAGQFDTSLPIFSFSRDNNIKYEQDTILIPDWMNLRGWPDLKPRLNLAKKYYSWQHKKNVMFWRGGNADASGFRHRLINYPKNQNILDAKFTYSGANKLDKFITPEEHLLYKYQLTIDGARATWERFVWQLASNCVVIKHNSSHVQWFYNAVKPYVHYFPITTDPNDLISVYNNLENNQNLALKIAKNGMDFADNNLALEDMLVYIINLLSTYKEQQVCL